MLADLTKCVLTLLSSPAPGGGPGSQGGSQSSAGMGISGRGAASDVTRRRKEKRKRGIVAQAPRHTKKHKHGRRWPTPAAAHQGGRGAGKTITGAAGWSHRLAHGARDRGGTTICGTISCARKVRKSSVVVRVGRGSTRQNETPQREETPSDGNRAAASSHGQHGRGQQASAAAAGDAAADEQEREHHLQRCALCECCREGTSVA